MNCALAIRTIQLLARLPELHVESYEMAGDHALAHYAEEAARMIICRIIIDDAAQLCKELKELCVTSAESTLAKTEPLQCSGTASSTPTST